MSYREPSQKSGLDRREALRRLVVGAGAAGAAAALPSAAYGSGTAHSAMPVPMPGHAPQTGIALGAAEPPDPSLTAAGWKPQFLDEHQAATVLAVGDLLIPATDTPGARAAQVDRFIDLLLSTNAPGTGEDGGNDFPEVLLRNGTLVAQQRYVQALSWLDGLCLKQYSKPFMALAQPEQEAVLDLLTFSTESPLVGPGRGHFELIRSSIISAYYSSKIGAGLELKYQANPYQTGMPECETKS